MTRSRRSGARLTLAVVMLGVALLAASCAHAGEQGTRRSIAVYALSRGKGVPPATRETYQKARALLQDLERKKQVGRLEETRLGLEGESRICVELTDGKSAPDVIEQLRALSRDVELLNVVEEPCHKGD